MPRYDVITAVVKVQGTCGEPMPSETHAHPGRPPAVSMSPPPPEFLTAVNAALAAGATLVGGVAITATPKTDESTSPVFAFSQAVLFP